MEELIGAKANVDTRSDEPKGITPLMAAACSNSVRAVETLIAHGANVNAKASNGNTVLEMGLLCSGQNAVRPLLEAIGGNDHPKASVALQFAMARNHNTTMALITTTSLMFSYMRPEEVDKFAWIDWALEQGGHLVKPLAMTKMLFAALAESDIDLISFLIARGCDVNRKLKCGLTPLAFAVNHRLDDSVELLIEAGADTNVPAPVSGKRGVSLVAPLHNAVMDIVDEVDIKVIDRLLASRRCRINQGTDFETAFSFILRKSKSAESKSSSENLVKRMVNSIKDVNADCDDNGMTLLHVATHCQCLWMVDLLLDRGADIEARAKDGTTPFLLACQKDPVFAMELASRGANVKARLYRSNATGLHVMAMQGLCHPPLFREMGLDANEQTLKGFTPLAYALSWGHDTLAVSLMDMGAHIRWKTNRNVTAAHLAARNGLCEAMEQILGYDIDVDAVDTKGWSALHDACATGSTTVVMQLLDAGADIERSLPNGDRPLHVALTNRREEIALLLLERGAGAMTIGSKNRTPLHLAANVSLPRVVQEILRFEGVNVDAVEDDTWTALCCARHPKIAKMLLAAGADVNHVDKNGWTALHQAVLDGETETAVVLVEAGASVEARTTDDGLSVRERAVDMWSWCDEHRKVIRPRDLRMAIARRGIKSRETVGGCGFDRGLGTLGGTFEIISA